MQIGTNLHIPEKHGAAPTAREEVGGEGGVEGEARQTAVGGRVGREGAHHMEAGLRLLDDYLVSQVVAAGHETTAGRVQWYIHTVPCTSIKSLSTTPCISVSLLH